MRISEETLNDIRESASISEVIGHYIPLTKKGKNFVATCPFHDDHDPSLSINEDKQIYKCFVCGNGGNVFRFVQNYKKISFVESVVEVAEIIGKPININLNSVQKKPDKNQKYYDLLNSYIEECSYLLSSTKAGEKAKEYLTNRGIDDNIISHFNLGYNPLDDFMYKYLHSNSYKDEDMTLTGICQMTNYGIRDVFYNRIIFPIHNSYGNPIAFTARDFEGKTDSKYINTADTPLYTKSNVLYNYHRAKDSCKRLNGCILVEGTMDVIAFYRAGMENVVASLGTALTSNHISLLKSLSNNIILCFDGDKAGQMANLKHGEILLKNGFNVEVVNNETSMDPDEIVNKLGKNKLKDFTSNRYSFIDYVLRYYKNNYDLNNYSNRKEITLKVSEYIDYLSDQFDKDNYANDLYELTHIRKVNAITPVKKEYNGKRIYDYHIKMNGLSKAELSILLMMSLSNDAYKIYCEELGYLLDKDRYSLATLIGNEYYKYGSCHLSRLIDEIDDEKIQSIIIDLATVKGLPEAYEKSYLLSAIEKVKKETDKRKFASLKDEIYNDELSDPNKADDKLVEFQKIIKEKMRGMTNGKTKQEKN